LELIVFSVFGRYGSIIGFEDKPNPRVLK